MGRPKKIRTAVIGADGYAAGELLRLLLAHPYAQLLYVSSRANAGRALSAVHGGLWGETAMTFCADFPLEEVDAVFVCLEAGESRRFWQSHRRPDWLRVIDLGPDFRTDLEGYVYGLPELNRSRMATALNVAVPGAVATAVQLSLLPLAVMHLLKGTIEATLLTPSSLADTASSRSDMFTWRSDNASISHAFDHPEAAEIAATLRRFHPFLASKDEETPRVRLVAAACPWTRGLLCMTVMEADRSEPQVRSLFEGFYGEHPFVVVAPAGLDLKMAVNTNKAIIAIDQRGGDLLITCALDNLLKGSAGQALQDFNLMHSLPETTGLLLKASAL